MLSDNANQSWQIMPRSAPLLVKSAGGGVPGASCVCRLTNSVAISLRSSWVVNRWAPWCGGEAPRAGGGGAEGRGGAKGEVPPTPSLPAASSVFGWNALSVVLWSATDSPLLNAVPPMVSRNPFGVTYRGRDKYGVPHKKKGAKNFTFFRP